MYRYLTPNKMTDFIMALLAQALIDCFDGDINAKGWLYFQGYDYFIASSEDANIDRADWIIAINRAIETKSIDWLRKHRSPTRYKLKS